MFLMDLKKSCTLIVKLSEGEQDEETRRKIRLKMFEYLCCTVFDSNR